MSNLKQRTISMRQYKTTMRVIALAAGSGGVVLAVYALALNMWQTAARIAISVVLLAACQWAAEWALPGIIMNRGRPLLKNAELPQVMRFCRWVLAAPFWFFIVELILSV